MLSYADEDFSLPVVEELRRLGHDVLTAQEDGHKSVPDPVLLARAHALNRAMRTCNRRHFERLHRKPGTMAVTSGFPHEASPARPIGGYGSCGRVSMSLEGHVQNGVIVLDDGRRLADATRVQVIVHGASPAKATLRDRLLKLAGTVDDLPADMARNHDHYIHGGPKR